MEISRRFAASPERVFRALSEADRLMQFPAALDQLGALLERPMLDRCAPHDRDAASLTPPKGQP